MLRTLDQFISGSNPRTDSFVIPTGAYKVKLYSAYYDRAIQIQEMSAYTLDNEKETDYESYIDSHMEVDRKIYISSKEGNDTTGNGTQNNPYLTLDKISEEGVIENGYSYAIVLMDGKYELTTKIFELNCNKKINIIGNKRKTVLEANNIYANNGGGSSAYEVNVYRLIWRAVLPASNTIYVRTQLALYNIVFDISGTSGYSYFIPMNKYVMYNCIAPRLVGAFLRTTGGIIQLTNCYGGFTSGYGTGNASWDYQTNYITETPQVEGITYRIKDEESKWKNVGTGTNPDGSRANLGVYGGEYSWEE